MVLGYFFQVFGMLAWWLINGICVLVTPYQQTLVDLLFKTRLVHQPDYDNLDAGEVVEEVVPKPSLKNKMEQLTKKEKPVKKKEKPVVAAKPAIEKPPVESGNIR